MKAVCWVDALADPWAYPTAAKKAALTVALLGDKQELKMVATMAM